MFSVFLLNIFKQENRFFCSFIFERTKNRREEKNIEFFFFSYTIDLKFKEKGRYQSGQLERIVNPLAYAFVGSNPTRPKYSFLNCLKV